MSTTTHHRQPIQTTDAPVRFDAFARDWFAHMAVHWKTSHRVTIEGILEQHLIPAFGSADVHTIDRRAILAFRTALARRPGRGSNRTLSAQRINHVMTVLTMILTEAGKQFGLIHNPAHDIPRLRVQRPDVYPFSLDEVRRLLAAVRADYRDYYVVRFFTGLRTGEIDGLQWRYVDFDSNEILVRETVVRNRLETPKTTGSMRDVEMTAPVRAALLRQYGATSDRSDFVFANTCGRPLNHNNVTYRIWYPLLRELGLTPRKPYQTRHTAATLWLAAGENPEWIARQLGHTSTQMLFDVYARYVPNLTRRDGSAFEALLRDQGFAGADEG